MSLVAEIGEAAWTARDLYPPAADAPRGDRAAATALVARLRDAGLLQREISALTGYSRSYVSALVSDPDGSKARARKRSYAGTCATCGAPTDGSNGRAAAPTICARCKAISQHDERRWTRETICAALRRFVEVVGRPPVAEDLHCDPTQHARFSPTRQAEIGEIARLRASGALDVPAYTTIRTVFGSIVAARRAAGIDEVPRGAQAHREPRNDYSTRNGVARPAPPSRGRLAGPESDTPLPIPRSRATYLAALREIRLAATGAPLPSPEFRDRVETLLADARVRARETLGDE